MQALLWLFSCVLVSVPDLLGNRKPVTFADRIIGFDKSRCLNQELTFTYTAQYFADNHVFFTDSNMHTLHLIDEDGYYTDAALLQHQVRCL